MLVRNGAVTPRPSREYDITFFVKGRPKSARQPRDSTVAARRVQSVTVPSSRVSRECCSPGLRSPPLKNARIWPSQTADSCRSQFVPLLGSPSLSALQSCCLPQEVVAHGVLGLWHREVCVCTHAPVGYFPYCL